MRLHATRARSLRHLLHPAALRLARAVAVVLVSSGGVATYATYDLAASFTDEVVDVPEQGSVPPDIGAIEGGVNILVTGIDEWRQERQERAEARIR